MVKTTRPDDDADYLSTGKEPYIDHYDYDCLSDYPHRSFP